MIKLFCLFGFLFSISALGAYLPGAVYTKATGNFHVEVSTVSPGSTCTVTNPTGNSWASVAATNGTGDCSINISGFTAQPWCVATPTIANGTIVLGVQLSYSSSTQLRLIQTYVSNGSTTVSGTSQSVIIMCMGK